MTRKELEDLGLSKEQVDSVVKINGADIENAKTVSVSEINNLQTEISGLKTQVKERDVQLETLKESTGDVTTMKQQITDLQKNNADIVTAHESEIKQLKVEAAVEAALTGANAKNVKAVKALLDLEDVKLDKDGTVKGLKEQIDILCKNEDSSFLFEESGESVIKIAGGKPVEGNGKLPVINKPENEMSYSDWCNKVENQ